LLENDIGRGEAEMIDKSKKEQALSGIDETKRRTLMRLGLGVAFVTPIVASFSLDGLTISKVHAATANGSGFIAPSNSSQKPSPV
jgi:hypothetical protein